jgi:hypothetical protein
MNLRQIEAFRAVMVAGTVTGAAARLRISQPAVSRLISQLERTTKLALFVRSKQRVYPTREHSLESTSLNAPPPISAILSREICASSAYPLLAWASFPM